MSKRRPLEEAFRDMHPFLEAADMPVYPRLKRATALDAPVIPLPARSGAPSRLKPGELSLAS